MALPANVELLFGERPEAPKLPAAQVSQQFDALMKSISGTSTRTVSREDMAALADGHPIAFTDRPTTAYDALTKALSVPDIIKGISSDALASVQGALATLKDQQPDLVKDLTLTSPLSTGLVAFDLEAPAKLLAPRPTPLRNRIPRQRGMGTSHRFKRITGFTGSGTGGVGNIHPGIVDSTQTNFAPSGAANSLYYARGPKISYAGDDQVVPYSQFSMSDEVTWSAQYSGQGYQDIRQLSRTSLLYASMLMEERMLLMGRGTQTGFLGALAQPTFTASAAHTPSSGYAALSGYTTNVYVKIVASAGAFGGSVASAAVSAAVTATDDLLITLTNATTQALGYDVYISTGASDPGDASRFYAGTFYPTTANTIEIGGALPTTGKTVPTGGDTSAYAAGYDGILPICLGPNSGYVKNIGGLFSTTNPGVEFQNAFVSLYNSVKADPDRILFNGADRKQLSDTLKSGTNSNYQLKITQDEISGVTLGDVAVAVLNEVTGKRVEMEVHPWLPQGVCPILSDTLPIPDTQVSNVWSVFNVQDYMGVDWPLLQFSYESSSYWYGTMVCFAPAWNGAVTGVTAA